MDPRTEVWTIETGNDGVSTNAIDLSHLHVENLDVPALGGGINQIGFLNCKSETGTFKPVNYGGERLVVTVAADDEAFFEQLDVAKFGGLRWVKLELMVDGAGSDPGSEVQIGHSSRMFR